MLTIKIGQNEILKYYIYSLLSNIDASLLIKNYKKFLEIYFLYNKILKFFINERLLQSIRSARRRKQRLNQKSLPRIPQKLENTRGKIQISLRCLSSIDGPISKKRL